VIHTLCLDARKIIFGQFRLGNIALCAGAVAILQAVTRPSTVNKRRQTTADVGRQICRSGRSPTTIGQVATPRDHIYDYCRILPSASAVTSSLPSLQPPSNGPIAVSGHRSRRVATSRRQPRRQQLNWPSEQSV
jgi:hypothetical protein